MKSVFFFIFSISIISKSLLIAQSLDTTNVKHNAIIEKNENKKAVLLYSQLIAKEPLNPENYSNRAFYYYRLELYKKAIIDLQKTLSFSNLAVEYKCNTVKLLGDCYYCMEEWEKAIIQYDKYLEYYFDNVSVNTLKAEALLQLERYTEAISTATSLINFKGENNIPKENLKDLYIVSSYSCLFIDSLKDAEIYWEKANRIDSTDINVCRIRAQLFFNKEIYDEAIKIYNNLLKRDSSLFYFKYFRAQAFYYQKKYNEAIKDFEYVKKHYIKNEGFFYKLGNSYMYLKKYNEALNNLLICIKLEPKDAIYHNQVSWCYYLMKRYNDALVYVNKSIALDPKYANAIDTRGCIFFKLGNYLESIRDFNKSITIDSTINNSYYYRALANLKINNTKKAQEDWQFLLRQKDYKEPEGEKAVEILIKEHSL